MIALVRTVASLVAPQGGQGTARRNAWAGMVEGAARARDAREAGRALALAEVREGHPSRAAR